MGQHLTDFNKFSSVMKLFGFFLIPKVMSFFKISFFEGKTSDFFRHLVHDTMATREREGIQRPDMLHLLMQARKGALKHEQGITYHDAGFATVQESDIGTQTVKREWSDDDLTAQAMIFFFAGFETVSTLLCFTAHELAVNPDIQKELQKEIDESKDRFGTVTYDNIHQLKYLDMVISESLRKWPPAPLTDRICVKPYILVNEDNKTTFEVKVNQEFWIPVYSIHRDPKYYPNPEKFDPERFNDENKENIKPYTYLPFGAGPRNCIGSRFALMEAKTLLLHLLSDFDFGVSAKTAIPLVLTKKSLSFRPDEGFWLTLKQRIKK